MLWRCGGWTGEKALGFCVGACGSRGYFGLLFGLFGDFWGFPGWGEGFRGRFKEMFLWHVTKLCDLPLFPYVICRRIVGGALASNQHRRQPALHSFMACARPALPARAHHLGTTPWKGFFAPGRCQCRWPHTKRRPHCVEKQTTAAMRAMHQDRPRDA